MREQSTANLSEYFLSLSINPASVTDEELTFKQSLVDLYKNETKPINTYWAQMIPYENWVKATDYVAGK